MITDKLLRVSEDQALTTTAVSTDTIDLSIARDIGEGEQLFLEFIVGTAFTAAGAATLTAQAITSAAAALTSPVVTGETGAIAVASLTAGTRFYIALSPTIGSIGQRYFGANYVVATGPMTAGTITCNLVHAVMDGAKVYASGYSVK